MVVTYIPEMLYMIIKDLLCEWAREKACAEGIKREKAFVWSKYRVVSFYSHWFIFPP